MVHCQTVANAYCEKFKRYAPRVSDSVLYTTGYFVKMAVSRYIIAGGAHYGDKRSVHFAVGNAKRL